MKEDIKNAVSKVGCEVVSSSDNRANISCNGKDIKLSFVDKKSIEPAYGYSSTRPRKIEVRKDLPKTVKRHVLIHEIGHQLGFWSEIKANLFAFSKDPVGWIKTAENTLKDPKRVAIYARDLGV